MAYQVPGVHPLWSPKQNGLDSVVTKVPGLLGIDHIGITVPNIDVAASWLEHNLGMTNPLVFGPFADPVGDFMTALVDVNPRAVVEEIRMLRGGNGPGAGQSINYFGTPFGTDVELISYPHGMAYEATAAIALWDPRDNHP